MNVATCIGCGCDDYHACLNEVTELPCGWLHVARSQGLGVCSECPEHVPRWDAGNRAPNVPIDLDQKATDRC